METTFKFVFGFAIILIGLVIIGLFLLLLKILLIIWPEIIIMGMRIAPV